MKFHRPKGDKTHFLASRQVDVVHGDNIEGGHKLCEAALEAAKRLDTGASVEYITDMEQIMASGVMRLPALLVDDRVLSTGRVLKAAEIEKLLRG